MYAPKLILSVLATSLAALPVLAEPTKLSGIYPHLAMFNSQGECGTGAVAPWADRLWVVTYAPHYPKGSDDKLYEITPDLELIIRPESIGGTPANRMIHEDSNQLFIGPYAIDKDRKVRAIPYSEMFGRPTGNARHLTNPSEKILYATMEEGIYEVDVDSLKVTELWADEATKTKRRKADLPGYHGKGFYSGQGVYVYSNNGEYGKAAKTRPEVPSGVLAEWDGKADAWTIIRRNQFTEITGPDGITGSKNPATTPIWAVGWDHKSLLLGVRMAESGWSFYRLPKGSHSYDGAHGWNTEWPRIREIGEDDFLMTMHGTFWKFPKTFTPQTSAGITPRSNYLKVIGDFARWGDRLVLGCDDTAQNEFLNKRKAKGEITGPQSQSNLWFIKPEQLDSFGPAIGRGAVWKKAFVKAGQSSDPFLFSGYDHRGLHLSHQNKQEVTVELEVDREGNGQWTPLRKVTSAPGVTTFITFLPEEKGTWIRLTASEKITEANAVFTYRNTDPRSSEPTSIFNGLAKSGDSLSGGLIRARDGNKKTLAFAAIAQDGSDLGLYELGADLKLKATKDPKIHQHTKNHTKIPDPAGILEIDAGSVIFIDDHGKRWRLPKGDPSLDQHPLGKYRLAREVATERDLFNAHGTFYELPARNAGDVAKLRPVATHNRLVHDFCSYRGLFVVSGVATSAPTDNPHILHSDDGKTALWAGAIDDIWQLGKPQGQGGPWKDSAVKAGVPSDPYLMTAYDQKSVELSATSAANITLEVDIDGTGLWLPYQTFKVEAGKPVKHTFPEAFSAYWVRAISDTDTTATAWFNYK
ncbi:hypothetical protein [Haloferula sp.]|uniref:hypothetical protein n=1 Tax=Haloferula sp. TaxID=2497595 RepID=UPI0032A12D4A